MRKRFGVTCWPNGLMFGAETKPSRSLFDNFCKLEHVPKQPGLEPDTGAFSVQDLKHIYTQGKVEFIPIGHRRLVTRSSWRRFLTFDTPEILNCIQVLFANTC